MQNNVFQDITSRCTKSNKEQSIVVTLLLFKNIRDFLLWHEWHLRYSRLCNIKQVLYDQLDRLWWYERLTRKNIVECLICHKNIATKLQYELAFVEQYSCLFDISIKFGMTFCIMWYSIHDYIILLSYSFFLFNAPIVHRALIQILYFSKYWKWYQPKSIGVLDICQIHEECRIESYSKRQRIWF